MVKVSRQENYSYNENIPSSKELTMDFILAVLFVLALPVLIIMALTIPVILIMGIVKSIFRKILS